MAVLNPNRCLTRYCEEAVRLVDLACVSDQEFRSLRSLAYETGCIACAFTYGRLYEEAHTIRTERLLSSESSHGSPL